ncbi:hypothetical protein L9F63_024662, partial [Diploptera punctata]
NPAGVKGLLTSQYRLISGDLQYLDVLERRLSAVGVKFDVPTLLLAECAICYMSEQSGSKLIEWAASKFTDATFITYEQVHPDDGFGIVMKKHFEDMRSPLLQLNEYPNLEAQQGRYLSRGWTSCRAWTAFEMFLKITSPEERKKILKLEPFDEFEEWHLEGCHFALMVASKGSLNDWFFKLSKSINFREDCAEERVQIQWLLSTASVPRFAHQTVLINENNVLVIGGFGRSSQSVHGRRGEILKVSMRSQDEIMTSSESYVKEIKPKIEVDALHHSCTQLSLHSTDGSTRVFVYGGRYSPCRPVNTWPVILNINQQGQETSVTVVETNKKSDKVPEPRWRHTAVYIKEHVVVYGGRTSDLKVLNDVFIWTVEAKDSKITWREIKSSAESRWPPARFSHSATVWQDRTMIVSGGLGEDILPLKDIWYYNADSESWQECCVCGILPRYSHTST